MAFPEAMLVPAYVNIHVHGAVGHDVMEGTPEALHAVGASLASHGVGGYYPTTVTSSTEETLRALDMIAGVIEREPPAESAVPLGIHLEGPFLSAAKRGVHTAALLVAAIDSAVRSLLASGSRAYPHHDHRAGTAHGARVDPACQSLGVVCSLGHSNASLGEAEAGFLAGARSATHTFNAMRSLDHRDPGDCRVRSRQRCAFCGAHLRWHSR